MANSLSLEDVPPIVKLNVISETFKDIEKLFTTEGSIARSVTYNSSPREISISSDSSLEYRFIILRGDAENINIIQDSLQKGRATIKFTPGNTTTRFDVGVFARRSGGKYYSVPGIVSLYIHP
jgi:hypothetical protein